jgi:ribosome-binding factor A
MTKNNTRGRLGRGEDEDRRARARSKSTSSVPARAAGPTQRMLRVGEMIRHELSAVLARGELHDEMLAATVVTIPEVRMSNDLKLATAYVMPLGGENVAAVVEALNRHKKYLRSIIANAINLKYAPDIRFLHDQTFDEAKRIDLLLNSPQVRQDTGRTVGPPAAPDTDEA